MHISKTFTILVVLLLGLTNIVISTSNSSVGNIFKNVQKPNIIIIIADDLGFNDVSFHGSSQIPTPNIDALAFSGVILNNYYVQPICTPTRSALFSGKHPIHTGMQHDVIYGAQPYGFPLETKLLPEYLKEFGYSTHLVGKWHMGHFRQKYTPLCRGFDTHFGPWTGHKDYYDNTAQEERPQAWGYDMRRNFETTYENWGTYTTELYSREIKNIIESHNETKSPLFLTISHTAVHSANPYALLQAPANTVEQFADIEDIPRRKYAAMVAELDRSIGETISALAATNLLSNSIVIFMTDNGGPAAGFNGNAASNWPLRGVKNTLWEGGVRGVGLIWSPMLKNTPRISKQLMHVQDWLPTILKGIGSDISKSKLGDIDGIDMWESLSNGNVSARYEILHNIDEIYGNEAVRKGNFKLLHGTTYAGKWDGWYGPSGRKVDVPNQNYSSIVENALNSTATMGMIKLGLGLLKNHSILSSIVEELQISCETKSMNPCNLKSGEYCLFDLSEDPCECNNLAIDKPQILQDMKVLLMQYRKSSVIPRNKPKDPRGQPKFWSYTWTNWMDFVEPENTSVTTFC